MDTFARHLGVKVDRVDASERFMRALEGVIDPEQKRKIIGREFVHVFQEEAAKLPRAQWLAQGTIYPDVIESAGAKTKKAHTIKSHHNVGGLPGNAAPQAARTVARTVQGRGARGGARARIAARNGVPPPVSGSRSRRPHPR